MHLEFLVEENSAEAALRNLVPKIIGAAATFDIHSHQGKRDFLAKLPRKLAAYRHWAPPDWRIVVLVDRDRDDCKALKRKLERTAKAVDLRTKSAPGQKGIYQVLNRLAIEELEAWFFGDAQALVTAYPRLPSRLDKKAPYRDPDAIRGGTWESLERLLQKYGYYEGGMPKIEVARQVSAQMDPVRNRSRSFQHFRQGLVELAG